MAGLTQATGLHPAAMPAPPAAAAAAPGIPGLVPVELSADRIQLMGMRTSVATQEKLGTSLRAVGFVAPTEDGVAGWRCRPATCSSGPASTS